MGKKPDPNSETHEPIEEQIVDESAEDTDTDRTDVSEKVNSRRVVERGAPITELVKGSHEYGLRMIHKAFYRQFGGNDLDGGWFYVEETFADHLVVWHSQLPVDEYYFVTYTASGETFEFAPRDEWEVVELTYQPKSVMVRESVQNKRGKRLQETLSNAARLVEAKKSGPRIIYADLAQADIINENGRRYPRTVLREAVAEAQNHLHESLSQGRATLLGEAEHPFDKRQGPRFLETIIVWEDLSFDETDGWARLQGRMIENSMGQDAIITMDAGVLPGISLRAYGESKLIDEGGRQVEEVQWMKLTGADLVLNPGFQDAAVTLLEAKTEMNKNKQADDVETGGSPSTATAASEVKGLDEKQAKTIAESAIAEHEQRKAKEAAEAAAQAERERQAQADKELREQLGLSPEANITEEMKKQAARIAEFEAKEAAAAVTGAISEAVANTPYPTQISESFKAYVENRKPVSVEQVKAFVEEAKAVFDPLAAAMRLKGMGMGDVQVIGDVLERANGTPGYAIAAHEISESMRRRGDWETLETRKARPQTRADVIAQEYLRRYDEQFQMQLIKESSMWREAMTSAALSLPYSVLRAVIDEAFPMLIASQAFDFGVVSQNPLRVYYEAQFTAESGFAGTATDESFTSDHDDWVDLAGHNIDLAGLSVTSDPAGTTYTINVDYVIDYLNGRIKVLSTGSMGNATGFLANYTYKAIRKGENVGIERAKSGLAYDTLNLTAERLATEISDETIKFSQSQLGFDAVSRTINLLVKEIMKTVDANLLNTAVGLAASVANNSGGTWTSATDSLDLLVKFIGIAKALVGNRNYAPTFVAMSLTNAEALSNHDSFTEAGGRSDSTLNSDGMVGRIKGLPVFRSTQMTDGAILVANKEIVQYRTFGNMELKGPYPTYDANRELVANEQWFVQEYNGFISPIPGKGAIVRVV